MTYQGTVRPGGPAEVRELADLMISKLSVGGKWDNNAYLMRCRRTDEQLLIDAANDPDRLLQLVGRDGLVRVVTTHRHADHHRALASVVAVTGAAVAAGADDADAIAEATDIAVTRRLHDGDTVRLGKVALTVVALRGHTPGSVALAYREPGGRAHLFTGDSLFPGGVGATQGPEAFDQLYSDVVARVFERFDDDTWVYPGHGRDTTLGAEREHLPEWRARGW